MDCRTRFWSWRRLSVRFGGNRWGSIDFQTVARPRPVLPSSWSSSSLSSMMATLRLVMRFWLWNKLVFKILLSRECISALRSLYIARCQVDVMGLSGAGEVELLDVESDGNIAKVFKADSCAGDLPDWRNQM
ncbi:hypothetical protein H310_10771 [Aphanomyces invadans]|uniref:Uncharacterized protein n=1 Tax=Aphanomyces invadans TaxID=157072 RepID=A0A024TQ52_9STRA|nr:hypothetical protein H310_10771 [Aphanomyces invadans]ETV96139.1 hypothetical protein H310_10771 [Aphanomyces invadans]|eukprot:XP_008875450.1 hypothetical protein H310_10771 [Aphanomyces invadans]